MTAKISYKAESGKEYRLKIDVESIQVERYSRSSVSGGSDTECGHTVAGKEAMLKVLDLLSVQSLDELETSAPNFDYQAWEKLHSIAQSNQTSYYLFD